MKLTMNEKNVLRYLNTKAGEWVSPTEIGHIVGGGKRHSAWASPICKRLVSKGEILRNDRGHYAVPKLYFSKV